MSLCGLLLIQTLWISFLITHKLDKLDHLLVSGKARLLFSAELFDEIAKTIAKPRLKKYLGHHAMKEMLDNLAGYIDIVEVSSVVNVCRDPDDNFLLSLAKDGNAHFLLTGDKDLPELKKLGKTQIVTIGHFLDNVKP